MSSKENLISSLLNLTSSKVIAIAQSKGGVGKSMASCNIAIDCANHGKKVLLIDAEEHGTTIDYQDREDINNLTVMNGYDKAIPLLINAYRAEFDIIIIDTAGVNSDMDSDNRDNLQKQITQKLLCASDLILIPVVPSPVDVRKTMRFIPSVENYVDASMGQRKALMFLNKAVNSERHTREAKKLLDGAFSIPFSKNSIRRTNAFEHAEGEYMSINEFQPSSDAAREMRLLQTEIFNILAK